MSNNVKKIHKWNQKLDDMSKPKAAITKSITIHILLLSILSNSILVPRKTNKARFPDKFNLLNRHSAKLLLKFCLSRFLLAQDISLETRRTDDDSVKVHAVFTLITVAAGDSGFHASSG